MTVEYLRIEIDNQEHFDDFIRLNEIWISEHFSIEESDRLLAANPSQIVTNGGHIFSLVSNNKIVGVCALFKDSPDRYQLARMVVEPTERRKGYGNSLLEYAIAKAKDMGASSIYLLSNTILQSAISLYLKHGFKTVSTGSHPVYTRCNIVMELDL
jgi:putative acetyltransferase